MKNTLRIVKLIIEIAVALVIFFIIVQKTPLFDRALPDRTPTLSSQKDTNVSSGSNTIPSSTILDNNPQFSSTNGSLSPITNSSSRNSTYKIITMDIGPVITTQRITSSLSSSEVSSDQTSSTLTSSSIIESPLRQLRSCRTPGGNTLPHGDSITMYRTSQANNANSCNAELRICQDGTLLGSYTHSSCSYSENGIIKTIDGTRIATIAGADDDMQRTIDTSDYYARRDKYTHERTQSPTINNTTLKLSQAQPQPMENTKKIQPDADRSDILDQVTVRDPSFYSVKSCRTPRGTRIDHGSFVYAFSSRTNTITQSCLLEKRACIDGELSGSYRYPSCQYSSGSVNPINITTRPSTIFRGTRFIRAPYVTPIGENIRTLPAYITHTSYPNNQSGHNYIYRSCTAPRGDVVPHNRAITAYRLPHGTANSACDAQVRRCRDGVLGGSFSYPTCTDRTPPLRSPRRPWRWFGW